MNYEFRTNFYNLLRIKNGTKCYCGNNCPVYISTLNQMVLFSGLSITYIRGIKFYCGTHCIVFVYKFLSNDIVLQTL